MTTLSLSTSSVAKLSADVIFIGLVKGTDGPVVTTDAAAVEEAFEGTLTETLAALGATGAEGELTRVATLGRLKAPLVIALGLGEEPETGFTAETLRKAAGNATRAAAGLKKAGLVLPLADAASVRAAGEGAVLGAYTYTASRGVTKDAQKTPVKDVVLAGVKGTKDNKAALDAATVIGESVNQARTLTNMPSNDLFPKEFASIATDLGKNLGFKVEILDEKALVKQGFGGIMGVGMGSAKPPRLVRLGYTHPKAKQTIALIGKGITYDSGGISLKPAGSNETMKMDMSGAGAVLSAVSAIARLGLKVNVTGWLTLAENMPSGTATRPGDVLKMYGGRTVEVLNTDAEGRLVLADAITRAGEESPAYMIDVATLTGAMMLALGNNTFGVMANDDDFRSAVVDAATEAGEQSWPMPLPADLRKSMDSPIADIKNMGARYGGGLVAGLFLQEFVADGISWAHLDIAGPAFNEGEVSGYGAKGGTGCAVRTLVQVAADLADGKL